MSGEVDYGYGEEPDYGYGDVSPPEKQRLCIMETHLPEADYGYGDAAPATDGQAMTPPLIQTTATAR
jgi:hypothetical protein